MFRLFGSAFFLAWTMMVALSDCRERRVSNVLILTGLFAAAILTLMRANPFGLSLPAAALGCGVGFAAMFPLFALRVMGAADVKVFAVLGAWCGVKPLLWLWLAASLLAGLQAIWVLIASRTSPVSLRHAGGRTFALGKHRSAPYAAFLTWPAAGWLAYLIYTGGAQ